jgi:hypothetical protein
MITALLLASSLPDDSRRGSRGRRRPRPRAQSSCALTQRPTHRRASPRGARAGSTPRHDVSVGEQVLGGPHVQDES